MARNNYKRPNGPGDGKKKETQQTYSRRKGWVVDGPDGKPMRSKSGLAEIERRKNLKKARKDAGIVVDPPKRKTSRTQRIGANNQGTGQSPKNSY